MRATPSDIIESCRILDGPYASPRGANYGAFHVDNRGLTILASNGSPEIPWEHVSVSFTGKPWLIPSWDQMCWVKRQFWEPSETVIQFHPPDDQHVNFHPGTLHLWKPPYPLPLPPPWTIAPVAE